LAENYPFGLALEGIIVAFAETSRGFFAGYEFTFDDFIVFCHKTSVSYCSVFV